MTEQSLKHKLDELKVIPRNNRGIQDQPVIHFENVKQSIQEFLKAFNNYMDCDWSCYSIQTSKVVKEIIEEVDTLAKQKFGALAE